MSLSTFLAIIVDGMLFFVSLSTFLAVFVDGMFQ